MLGYLLEHGASIPVPLRTRQRIQWYACDAHAGDATTEPIAPSDG
jgi:hypothetical protein